MSLPAAWLVHRVEVYEDGGALLDRLNGPDFDPRAVALLEGDPPCVPRQTEGTEDVRVVRRSNNRLTVAVNASSPAVLLLSEVFYPGWQVRVDGERAELFPADCALRAVCVPSGEHTVTMVYSPRSLWVGLGITLLFALLVVGAAGGEFLRRRRRGG